MEKALKSLKYVLLILVLPFLFLSCGTLEPKDMELPIEQTGPVQKVTTYTETLNKFGLMMEIYRDQSIKLMVKEIVDKTGASDFTGSEIQRNITEIVKSTLNSMGENVVFIEYDPEFVGSMQTLGYSDFSSKFIPDIIVTGAITEFDRALESWEKGKDVGAEVELTGMPKWLPSKSASIEYGDTAAANKARITVDFNLKKFETLAGIPGMNIVNSMEVQKAQKKQEFGITIFGPTFGSKGSLKKVQGRHDAVRLLVQSGLIQLVGRFAGIPYWRLFEGETIPDEAVLTSWKRGFPRLDDETKVFLMQKYLYLHGYDVDVNGKVDEKTKAAFVDFRDKNNLSGGALNSEFFLKVYLTVPINEDVYARSVKLSEKLSQATAQQSSQEAPVIGKADQPAQPEVKEVAYTKSTGDSKGDKMIADGFNAFQHRDYQKASQYFEESVKTSPAPVVYYYLALSYQSMNDKKRATTSLEEAVKKFDKDFPLWKALGMIYYEGGNEQKAKSAFKNALALKPNDKQVKFLMDRMK